MAGFYRRFFFLLFSGVEKEENERFGKGGWRGGRKGREVEGKWEMEIVLTA
jgi:hypothetical protein